jgi:serine/threonine protein kinase
MSGVGPQWGMRARARPGWTSLPEQLRRRIEDGLGFRVDRWTAAETGFSPGFAGTIGSSDGGAAFVKTAHRPTTPKSAELHATEARMLAALPRTVVPELRWVLDDGEWVVLALEVVSGRQPGGPWTDADLDAVLAATRELATVDAPIRAPAEEFIHESPDPWASIADDDVIAAALPARVKSLLGALIDLETAAADASAGSTLVHLDIRADNVLIDARGRARLLDWPHAVVGSELLDLVLFAPSVPMGRGPSAADVARRYLGGAPLPSDILPLLVYWAGRLVWSAAQPEQPGLDGLRAFQRAQADAALDWMAELF